MRGDLFEQLRGRLMDAEDILQAMDYPSELHDVISHVERAIEELEYLEKRGRLTRGT